MPVEHTIVAQRVALARKGANPWLVCRLPSGWVVMCDKQVVPGQLILLSDPVVATINDLGARERVLFLADMVRIGDALLATTGCVRVNYEILGNTDPALHAHVVPRYASEPDDRRAMPIWLYDWTAAEAFSETSHGELRRRLGEALRQTIGREGGGSLVHKAVPVVVREQQGRREILVFRHPRAGMQIVKGTVEDGESHDAAALRELREESGIAGARVVADLGSSETIADGQVWHFFQCEAGKQPARWMFPAPDDGGHIFHFSWHPLDEDAGEDWHPIFLAAMRHLRTVLASNG